VLRLPLDLIQVLIELHGNRCDRSAELDPKVSAALILDMEEKHYRYPRQPHRLSEMTLVLEENLQMMPL